MDTAESTGARETTVPEERSAAVRRDGEPLTSEAKRRRQTESETDAEASRMDAGERPPSPTREDEEEPPPLREDPAGQEAPAAAITGREGGAHENSSKDFICDWKSYRVRQGKRKIVCKCVDVGFPPSD